METVEIKFEDGQEVETAHPAPRTAAGKLAKKLAKKHKGRPAIVEHLLDAKCSRCHGSGKEPGREAIPLAWDDVLEQLDKAGDQRAAYSDARGEDWQLFKEAWDTIRELWPKAQALGVPQGMAAQAVGVTRAQFSAQMSKHYEERVAARTKTPPATG